ncbi:hypothetical protein MKW98_002659 [Papaver atlanticum]|uniref:Uncharacterized protein n=1 Tax=Papaver atlanticum TaxID=357466 RepID=A0AAD4SCK5_9MAGN|nr:hypothetical protein MKW98_002659 [Papaver atlanticum]
MGFYVCCKGFDWQEAVEATLERNPSAFRPKIVSSPDGMHDTKANYLRPSSTFSISSPSPGVHVVNPALTGSSKPTYRCDTKFCFQHSAHVLFRLEKEVL